MDDQHRMESPVAETGMLIRRPVGEVFEAIVDPAVTSKFWFSKGSARLDAGTTVVWEWEWYDASAEVTPVAIETDRRIRIEWPGYTGPTTVEWTFQPLPDGTTFVRVTEQGWTGEGDEMVRYVADSTQGFTLMLAGMKALLEHGIRLHLTEDRFPKAIRDQAAGD